MRKKGHTVVRSHLHIRGFEFVKNLGSGGFAETFLYRDLEKEFGEYVVVKVPHDKQREYALLKGDLASLTALRNQEYIVNYCDIRLAKEQYVLLMEYVKGPTLREILGKIGSAKPLPVHKAERYALQIAKGLRVAHGLQMVHRDIKPDNLIIEEATDAPKILDFGISTLKGKDGVFETELYRRTVGYTPLEILMEGKGDHRVDIFSLGVTLFEMLTGILPYFKERATEHQIVEIMRQGEAPSPRDINPGICCYLDRAVQKAIAPRKEDRYQSIDEFIEVLNPPVELKLADEHQKKGNVRKAEHILRSLTESRPYDQRGYVALAALLNRCRRFADASGPLHMAVELDPQNPMLLMSLGATTMRLGDARSSKKYLKMAFGLTEDAKLKRTIQRLLSKVPKQ